MKQIAASAFNFAQGSGTVVFLTAVIWNFSDILSSQNSGWKRFVKDPNL